jgi:hypothetical protein
MARVKKLSSQFLSEQQIRDIYEQGMQLMTPEGPRPICFMTKTNDIDDVLSPQQMNDKMGNTQPETNVIYIEDTVGPPREPKTIQYYKGMTTEDVARAVAEQLKTKKEDILVSFKGITLPSDAIIQANSLLQVGPISRANAIRDERLQLLQKIAEVFYFGTEENNYFNVKYNFLRFSKFLTSNRDNDFLNNFLSLNLNKDQMLDYVLNLMFYIHSLDYNKIKHFKGLTLESLENIKRDTRSICYNYIFKNNLVSINSIELFDLLYSISFYIYDTRNMLLKKPFTSFNDINNYIIEKIKFNILDKIKNEEIPSILEIKEIADYLFDIRKTNIELGQQIRRKVYNYYDTYITIKDYELLSLISPSIPKDLLLRDNDFAKELEIYYYSHLIEELINAGTKITPERVIGILKQRGGYNPIKDDQNNIIGFSKEHEDEIIWLELGDVRAGIIHILLRHEDDFGLHDIYGKQEIVKLILKAIKENYYIHFEGGHLYEITNEKGDLVIYLQVVIASNGFMITAFPYDDKAPPKWVLDKFNEIRRSY